MLSFPAKRPEVLSFNLRFVLIHLPGRVVELARKRIVWVSGRHPSLSLLVRARSMIALSGNLGNPYAQGHAVDYWIPRSTA